MKMSIFPHQYVDRCTGAVQNETLLADRLIFWMYNRLRERPSAMFQALVSKRFSSLIGWAQYDVRRSVSSGQLRRAARAMNLNEFEFVKEIDRMQTFRELFERQIRYWICRPMNPDRDVIVSPADARMLIGSFSSQSALYIKDKLFDFDELLGWDYPQWRAIFRDGDFAVFRLTPDKYHYNHTPVSGYIADIYDIPGLYHACNPSAVVQAVSPLSKNRRTVSIVDTDVADGTGIGYVAMIEIAALMIGDIVQCYSGTAYEAPRPVHPGLFVNKGQPKSLFRPGSSTTVLIFEKGRVRFSADLLANQRRSDVISRYSIGFGQPLAETDISVRSEIAVAIRAALGDVIQGKAPLFLDGKGIEAGTVIEGIAA
ncbi:MAG: phosphatidylserine decarboxylase [Thermodesulfobacteriota bacterium]